MAWAISLIVIVGGALYLQFTYDEADYVVDEPVSEENANTEEVANNTPESVSAENTESTESSGEIAVATTSTRTSTINAFDIALSEDSRDGKLPIVALDDVDPPIIMRANPRSTIQRP